MKFRIGSAVIYPFELVRKPANIIITVLLIIVFGNVFTMWGDVFSGRLPYGSSEDFQTLNGEFKYTMIMSKFTTAEEELSELNNAFDSFVKDHPTFKNAIIYRTSEYYNIHVWMFWKWYRYFEKNHILQYPYLDLKH